MNGEPRPVALAFLVAWVSWPITTLVPAPGLDPGYAFGLQQALHQGLVFGRTLVFTYGPLGFLSMPELFRDGPAIAAWTFSAGVQVLFCLCIYVAARRLVRWQAAVPLAWVASWLTSVGPGQQPGVAAEVMAVTVAVAAVLLLTRPPERFQRNSLLLAGAAVSGAELLIKVDAGLVCLGVVLVTAFALSRRPVLAAVATAGATVGFSQLFWVLTGQPAAGLPRFLSTAGQIIGGYPDALALEQPGRTWEYVAAGVLTAVFTLAWLRLGRGEHRWAAGLILAGVLVADFRHGFVRHDAHSDAFFFPLAALALAAGERGRASRVWQLAIAAVAATCLAVITAPFRPGIASQLVAAVRPVRQVQDLFTAAGRRQLQDAGRRSLIADAGLPRAAVRLLAGKNVQVDPWDTSLVWADRLAWNPVPLFQLNVAVTHSLDALDVAALASPHRPQAILRSRTETLDGVPAPWQSPAYQVALLCRYRSAWTDSGWTILLPAPDRCGRPRVLERRSLPPGGFMPIPRPGGDAMVTASLQLARPGWSETLRRLLFKPSSPEFIELDGRRARLYRGVATGPLLLTAPAGEALSMAGPASPGSTFGLAGADDAATVTLSEIPLIGPNG